MGGVVQRRWESVSPLLQSLHVRSVRVYVCNTRACVRSLTHQTHAVVRIPLKLLTGEKSQFCTGVKHNEGSEKFFGAQFLIFHLPIASLSAVSYSPT